jgi:predicted nucleic acid-binding protein
MEVGSRSTQVLAIAVLGGRAETLASIQEFQFVLPATVVGELRHGALNSRRSRENLLVERLVARCVILPVTESTADVYARTRLRLREHGFYDSGFIQPVDFFGTGPRVPMIAVSPFSMGGHISHVYNEHSSFVKFIERNWRLPTLTGRSRDNLPNRSKTMTTPMSRATCRPSVISLIGWTSTVVATAMATTTKTRTVIAIDSDRGLVA